MNRTPLGPILILTGLGGTIGLMAGTHVLSPLVLFVHSDTISPLQAAACFVFTALGFWACFFLLNRLCSYFVPRIESDKTGKPEPQQTQKIKLARPEPFCQGSGRAPK